jgi:hypothetical protein
MHTPRIGSRASMRARTEAGNCVRTCGKRKTVPIDDSRCARRRAHAPTAGGISEKVWARGAATGTAHADRTAHGFPIGVGDRPSRVAGPRPPCARARAAVTMSR